MTVYGPQDPLEPGARYTITRLEHPGCDTCTQLAHMAGKGLGRPELATQPRVTQVYLDATTRVTHQGTATRERAQPWTPAHSRLTPALLPDWRP